jgi:hypothetical protein
MHPAWGIGSERLNAEKKSGLNAAARSSAGGRRLSVSEQFPKIVDCYLKLNLLLFRSCPNKLHFITLSHQQLKLCLTDHAAVS